MDILVCYLFLKQTFKNPYIHLNLLGTSPALQIVVSLKEYLMELVLPYKTPESLVFNFISLMKVDSSVNSLVVFHTAKGGATLAKGRRKEREEMGYFYSYSILMVVFDMGLYIFSVYKAILYVCLLGLPRQSTTKWVA